MGGMIAYALSKPTGALDKWGAFLTVGLFGLIGCGILSFFVKSSALFWITSMWVVLGYLQVYYLFVMFCI